jgi:hypothetical protein
MLLDFAIMQIELDSLSTWKPILGPLLRILCNGVACVQIRNNNRKSASINGSAPENGFDSPMYTVPDRTPKVGIESNGSALVWTL